MKTARKRKRRSSKRKSRSTTRAAFPYRASAIRRADSPGSDFLDETIAIWQPRAHRPLTREDAREIVENVTGFFRILQEWDTAERLAQNAMANSAPSHENAQQSDIRHEVGDLEESSLTPVFAGR